MHTEVYLGASAFQELGGEWKALLAGSASDTPFLTPAFQRVWWEAFGEEGTLHLVIVRADGEELVGLAPFYRVGDGQMLRLVGGLEVGDYLDVIAASGREEAVFRAVLAHLMGNEAPPWQVLELQDVPADSPTRKFLPGLSGELGLGFREEVEAVCPAVELPATWEEYLAALPKKERHEVRRKLRRAAREAEVRYRCILGGKELEAAIEDFIALHRSSAAEKDAFMDARMQGFFRALIRAFAERGWARLEFLEVNGERVASLLNFDYRGAISVYNSGYLPGRYASLSPGVVLLAHSIREAIALGRRLYDFLRGDEDYKYRLGGKERFVYRLTLTREG